jgi:cobalt-zinc-cadmium efflux system protein
MAADAGISFGVVITGTAIMATGWMWIDPVVSLIIVAIIAIATWGLLRDALNLSIDSVPKGIDAEDVKAYFQGLKAVEDMHDLHIWALSTTRTALTVHLTVRKNISTDDLLQKISSDLEQRFGIVHVTVQMESRDGSDTCRLNSETA